MAVATAGTLTKSGVSWKTVYRRTSGISSDLKDFRRLNDEGCRQSLAMGLTDDTIEDFINEVIHEGR